MTTAFTSELLGQQENGAHSITGGALTSKSASGWDEGAERPRIREDRTTYDRAHREHRETRYDDR